MVLLAEALLHHCSISGAFGKVVGKASHKMLSQNFVLGPALLPELWILNAERVFAEEVEKASVAPVPVDDATELGWLTLVLSDEQVPEVQVGADEPVRCVERRVAGVLLEILCKLLFDGRVESPGTFCAIGIIFFQVRVDVVRGVGKCIFTQRLPPLDLVQERAEGAIRAEGAYDVELLTGQLAVDTSELLMASSLWSRDKSLSRSSEKVALLENKRV